MTPEEFFSILHSASEPAPVFFRLYHDEQGRPVCYSMEDLPGNYVEVDSDTYRQASYNVRVIDGALTRIDPGTHHSKLIPSTESGIACHVHDVCVIVDRDGPHQKWSIKHAH